LSQVTQQGIADAIPDAPHESPAPKTQPGNDRHWAVQKASTNSSCQANGYPLGVTQRLGQTYGQGQPRALGGLHDGLAVSAG